MSSIRYASLDEYWPAVRARAFAAEVRSLGGGPGFTTPRRLTYAKNMEILAEWAKVPVSSMPWVNPITFAERLCSAAFSNPAYLTKIMGKSTYSSMLYFTNCSTNILPEPRPKPVDPVEQFIEWSRRQPLAPSPAPPSHNLAEVLRAEGKRLDALSEEEYEEEQEEEQVSPAVRIERAENKAEALERQFQALEAMWMSAMARAEEAEDQVCQLKKEVAQVHLADMIARDATARANLAERNFLLGQQRATNAESNFVRLQKAISTVLYDADHVYHTKIYDEYERTST